MRKKEKTKNGAERRNKIFAFIDSMVIIPASLKKVHSKLQRRREFKNLEFSTFYYNVKILMQEQKIYFDKNTTIHPKKKPIFLIASKPHGAGYKTGRDISNQF